LRPAPPETRPPAEGEQRYQAVVAYDGSSFHGFASNPEVPTVGGSLTDALSRITGRPITLACAGRTDAGVHAWGQVVSFDARLGLDPRRLRHSLNRMLGPAIVVRELSLAPDHFDARFSASRRTYRYRVLNREIPDPFLDATSWHVRRPLDVELMNIAAGDLVGEHDFTSFCRRKLVLVDGTEVEADLTRTIVSSQWQPEADGLVDHWITAHAFCHQMVRAVTGTLIEIGLGKRPADDMPKIFGARDRAMIGPLAPPWGLTLWSVGY
jgi:tRNA pseudouridine38-40 synthase